MTTIIVLDDKFSTPFTLPSDRHRGKATPALLGYCWSDDLYRRSGHYYASRWCRRQRDSSQGKLCELTGDMENDWLFGSVRDNNQSLLEEWLAWRDPSMSLRPLVTLAGRYERPGVIILLSRYVDHDFERREMESACCYNTSIWDAAYWGAAYHNRIEMIRWLRNHGYTNSQHVYSRMEHVGYTEILPLLSQRGTNQEDTH